MEDVHNILFKEHSEILIITWMVFPGPGYDLFQEGWPQPSDFYGDAFMWTGKILPALSQ